MPKLLCVYCSSSSKLADKYYELGAQLGEALVARGWGLIYGGGSAGIMGAVAKAVKQAGGHVVGVIPDFMIERELAFDAADELVVVPSMRERKRIMAERADGFVTLPGGIGTLEELLEIMTERYLNLSQKPLVLLNQDGYYDDLLRFFERMVSERFKSENVRHLVQVSADISGIWTHLDNPTSFERDPIWSRPPWPSADK